MKNYGISIINPIHPNNTVGIYSTTGGDVSYGALATDFTLPAAFSMILVGTGGDIIFEDFEGNAWARYGVPDGSIIPVCAKKILASATIGGTPRTTTCQKITWEMPTNLVER